MGIKIDEFIVEFIGETEGFEEANKTVDSALKTLRNTAVLTGLALEGAFIFASKKAIDYAKDINDIKRAASASGLGTTLFEALSLGADREGIKVANLVAGVNTLQQSINDAVGKGRGLAEIFEGVGVSIFDDSGNLRTGVDLLAVYADIIASVEDPLERINLLTDTFGKTVGPKLAPLLSQGGDVVRALTRDYEELGLGITGSFDESAEALTRNIEALKQIKDGLSARFFLRFIPLLEQLTNNALEWWRANRMIIEQRLDAFLDRVFDVLMGVFNITVDLARSIDAVAQAFGGWGNVFDVALWVAGGLALSRIWTVVRALGVVLLATVARLGAFRAMLAGLARIPVVAWILAIGAALQDYRQFIQGGEAASKTWLAHLERDYPRTFAIVFGLFEAMNNIIVGAGRAFSGLTSLIVNSIEGRWSEAADAGRQLLMGLARMFFTTEESAKQFVDATIMFFSTLIEETVIAFKLIGEAIMTPIKLAIDGVFRLFDRLRDGWNKLREFFGQNPLTLEESAPRKHNLPRGLDLSALPSTTNPQVGPTSGANQINNTTTNAGSNTISMAFNIQGTPDQRTFDEFESRTRAVMREFSIDGLRNGGTTMTS